MKVPPTCKAMCATCPFRKDSPLAGIAESFRATDELLKTSRICHSTGNSVIKGRTGKPERLCRGARDEQLAFFVAVGFLKEATDAAWAEKLKELTATT